MTAAADWLVEPGFGAVADAMRSAFVEGRELGAAVAVYVDGRPVVDLWGGLADASRARPWERDTIVTVMSTTKGVMALAVHLLVERGGLDLDAPVARYWPEFARAGKEAVTVRQALSHQAGLMRVDAELTFDELCAYEPVIRAIEGQRPLREPGTKAEYHAITWGFIVAELVARVTGRTIGRFFSDEVAEPLGLRAWLGLPEAEEPHVARLEPSARRWETLLSRLVWATVLRRPARAITFGAALPARLVTGGPNDFNSRRLREIELAAANLVSDARSLARVYGAAVGEVDGFRLLRPETVDAARAVQTAHLPGPRFGLPRRDFSLGFTTDAQMLGPTSFGFFGAGGSLAFADVEHRIGFGYVMNRMDGVRPSLRGKRLVDVLRTCLR